jgi:hypothetical protein
MLLTRLVEVVEENIDHSRVVSQLRRTEDWALQLGQKYLKTVQKYDLSSDYEALNEVRSICDSYSISFGLRLTFFLVRFCAVVGRRRGL